MAYVTLGLFVLALGGMLPAYPLVRHRWWGLYWLFCALAVVAAVVGLWLAVPDWRP